VWDDAVPEREFGAKADFSHLEAATAHPATAKVDINQSQVN
jgi:hypothetical protein